MAEKIRENWITISIGILVFLALYTTQSIHYYYIWIIALALFFIHLLTIKRSVPKLTLLEWSGISLVAFSALTVFWSIDPPAYWNRVIWLIAGVLLWGVIRKLTSAERKNLTVVLRNISGIYIVFLLLMYTFGIFVSFYGNLTAAFSFHNVVASIISLSWWLWFVYVLEKKNAYGYIGLGITTLALCMTMSKGAILSLVIVLLVSSIYTDVRHKIRHSWKHLAAILGIAIVLSMFFVQRPEGNVCPNCDVLPVEKPSSIQTRIQYWSHGAWIASITPFEGFGLGSYARLSGLRDEVFVQQNLSPDPHNSILKIYVELGFAGLIFFLAFIALAIISLKEKNPPIHIRMMRLAALAWLLHSLIDIHPHFEGSLIFFLVCAALAWAPMGSGKRSAVPLTLSIIFFVCVSWLWSRQYVVAQQIQSCNEGVCMLPAKTYPFGVQALQTYLEHTNTSPTVYIKEGWCEEASASVSLCKLAALKAFKEQDYEHAYQYAKGAVMWSVGRDIEGEQFVAALKARISSQ